ncbi:MAG: response regulator transcription factor [Cyanobacteria bacterium J06638_22]
MPEEASRILIVSHELKLLAVMRDALIQDGYNVKEFQSCDYLISGCLQFKPDLIVTEWEFPGTSALKVCEELTRNSTLHPLILAFSKRSNLEAIRVSAYSAGVDDLMPYGFSSAELSVRVYALLRRQQKTQQRPLVTMTKHLLVEVSTQRIYARTSKNKEADTELSALEFNVVYTMVSGIKNQIWTREMLLERVWGKPPEEHDLRIVDTIIARIRRKFRDKEIPDLFNTVKGSGYSFVDDIIQAERNMSLSPQDDTSRVLVDRQALTSTVA